MDIKVSVIVPLFNASSHIEKTILSLINQNFQDYEIIVVDDGSIDDGLEKAQEILSKSPIAYKLVYQRNKGVSAARNTGMEVARGEYFLFVDDDDYISPNHINCLYNAVKNHDFALTKMFKVNSKGEYLTKDYTLASEMSCEELIKLELNMVFPFSFCQLIYPSNLIKDNNIKFSTDVIYGEDTEFALKALIHGKTVGVCNEASYFYLQHEGSATSTAEFKRFNFVETLENIADYYKNRGYDNLANEIIHNRIPRAIFGNMNYFFYNGYSFDDVVLKMKELNLFNKLSQFKGNFKFSLKIKLFLLNPKIYYKMWMKFKKSI